ncbi:MAG: DNA-3-methyladenine glycosylase [Verrucomicrobiota bacterium]|nr:DNA-3-methyladenine glycosylase [Verrucomicrobiota bacterium]
MNTETIQHLSKADKVLGRLIRAVGPCTLKPEKNCSPFQSLVRSVAYQQLTGKAAATILGRVKDLFPTQIFPEPEDLMKISEEQLRAAGLSGAKVRAVKDIAAKTLSGVVPSTKEIRKLSDEEILTRLTTIRGVGPWTVEMLLIFRLGREDVLPITDYGVRKGFALTYKLAELPTPKELLDFGEKWRPYRSTAAWYLWRALDL